MCLLYKIVLCLARNFCPICSINLVHISLEAPLNCSNLGAQLSFKSNKGVYSQLEAVEVQEKIKHIFCYFFFKFKDVLIAKHELSSLENIWVHAKVDIFEPILHIYQCLAGWKKQIMYE